MSATFAGLLAVLVALAASGVVFQAAHALHAQEEETASWIWALCIGGGALSIVLSIYYRLPVAIAWSTPGAALLITSGAGLSMADAIGAFLVCAVLILVFGFTGWFHRILRYIPHTLASGMLAGVMLRFGLDVFTAAQNHLMLVSVMLGSWILARCWSVRYSVLFSVAAGVAVLIFHYNIHLPSTHFILTRPVFISPHFSLPAIIGLAIPLFIVTLTSQHLPGITILRTHGYDNVPVSALTGWSGVVSLLFAPFGAFALCLIANTAALCTGHETHEDHDRRYVSTVTAGLCFVIVGLFGTQVTSLLEALPKEFIFTTAGIALFGAIGNGLAAAMVTEQDREAALITFLATASGITLGGIGSSFWGLIIGLISLVFCRIRARWMNSVSKAA